MTETFEGALQQGPADGENALGVTPGIEHKEQLPVSASADASDPLPGNAVADEDRVTDELGELALDIEGVPRPEAAEE